MLETFLLRASIFYLMMLLLTLPGEAVNKNFMRLGGYTDPIPGHKTYCQHNPDDCGPTDPNQVVIYDSVTWKQAVAMNTFVNRLIDPVTDKDNYGGIRDWWAIPVGFTTLRGDCEDYALMKRQKLIDQGIPPGALLLTVVRQNKDEGHAVLTVRTDRGDYILDNRYDGVWLWHETDYTFMMRQSVSHAGRWVSIIE